MRLRWMLAVLVAGGLCSSMSARAQPETAVNLLHITRGGVAFADPDEGPRHWSTWTINLIDGSRAYGWVSTESMQFPHRIRLEVAGVATISGVALDSRFEAVVREDGSTSTAAQGSPVRAFEIWGGTESLDGRSTKLLEGEAAADERSVFTLPSPVSVRWLTLVVKSNWRGGGQTRLSELEALGRLTQPTRATVDEVSGAYTHEYGPIALKRDGDAVLGCYNRGDGRLSGLVVGRVLRMAWSEPKNQTIGMATFSVANGMLYGFWYRDGDRMGSPWIATRVSDLSRADLGPCRRILYPGGGK